MHYQKLVIALTFCALQLNAAAETVLGVYIFSRHGDRTSKSHPPANLTNLGAEQIYTSGSWYRNNYIANGAPMRILGVNPDIVKQSQINVEAPEDTVLFSSALAFLQALYPPSGPSANQTLRNGSVVEAPFNGVQYIPVYTDDAISGGQEDSVWLQGGSTCAKAKASSNEYFSTPEYTQLDSANKDFYASLAPVLNTTFAPADLTYKNAYAIWDEINVALIHNKTIPSSDILTPAVFDQAAQLAADHEWALAWNASSTIRAISGSTLAAQIVAHLNTTITGQGKSKISIQFGAYGSFQSFFGLAGLPSVSPIFTAIPDYASSMVFELVTNATANSTSFPAPSDISVRFKFHNGTITSNDGAPVAYPLFGQSQTLLSWSDFQNDMNKFAIGGSQYCQACGNSTGSCASSSASASASAASSSSSGSGLTVAEGGVIGAFVTLAVILGLTALFLLIGGFRVVKKSKLAGGSASSGSPHDHELKA